MRHSGYIIISIALLFVLRNTVQAQQVLSNKSYQLVWDNDVFMMTDYYYTQGISFAGYHPVFKKNPVNLILLKPKDYNAVIYGFSGYQKTYTPKNIGSIEIQHVDRPYAGVLIFTSHLRAANRDKGWLFSVEFDIGVMGPASGAGQVQYRYHDLTDNQLPNGWQYQQYNWPVLNYNFEVSKQIYASPFIDLDAKFGTCIGTLHDDASVGMLFRIGKMRNYIESLGLPLLRDASAWQMYFNAEPTITIVAYNATLMGGWYRNPKIHYIGFGELTKVIGRLRSGLGLGYKSFGLTFDVILQLKEFKGGMHHWYTSTKLYLNF